jgi:hypothetical protein
VSDAPDTKAGEAGQGLRRRGLFAAAWAAVVGMVAFRSSKTVEATSGSGTGGNLVIGSNFLNTPNRASTLTLLTTETTPNFDFTTLFDVDPTYAGGTTADINALYAHGKGTGAGVVAVAGGTPAVQSDRVGFNSAVSAFYHSSTPGGTGIYAEVPGTSTVNAISVYGANLSSFAGAGPGAGGFGVYGLSVKGHGLVGAVASSGAAAVVGAVNGVDGALAAAFYGPVVVSGSLTVVGAKSAAVPHPDGSHRLLYCVESPESWFEDFGSGQLDCGQADVAIDPDFSAATRTEDYHVFLTEYDQHSDLFVTERTPSGFQVRSKDASSNGKFSWRIVAKRRDIPGDRFARVTIPVEPDLPKPPAPDARVSGRNPAVPRG